MENDDEMKWFDGIVQEAAWPLPPSRLENAVMARVTLQERPPSLRGMGPSSLMAAAVVGLFVLGVCAQDWMGAGAGQTLFNSAPYYTGSGLYMAERMTW